jgi:uncharacterized protein (TIGR02996 family)
MPSLLEVFEEDLVTDPEDIVTHMAYADYLQEVGDPRGEFIHVQLMLESKQLLPDRRQSLKEQETRLLNENMHNWLGELSPFLLQQSHTRALPFAFRRGWLDTLFVDELTSPVADVLAQAPQLRLLRSFRIEHIFLTEEMTVSMIRLFGSRILRKVRNLRVHSYVDSWVFDRIVESAVLGNVKVLRFDGWPLSVQHIATLTAYGTLSLLHELGLRNCSLTDDSAHRLASYCIKKLDFLDVRDNFLTTDGIQALQERVLKLEAIPQGFLDHNVSF